MSSRTPREERLKRMTTNQTTDKYAILTRQVKDTTCYFEAKNKS